MSGALTGTSAGGTSTSYTDSNKLNIPDSNDVTGRLDEADKRFVKETMLEGVSNLLPEIVEEITPIILQKTAKLVSSNVNKYGSPSSQMAAVRGKRTKKTSQV